MLPLYIQAFFEMHGIKKIEIERAVHGQYLVSLIDDKMKHQGQAKTIGIAFKEAYFAMKNDREK